MIEGLESKDLEGALMALLFVTDEPANVLALANMLEAEAKEVEEALCALRDKLERDDFGIQLREVAGGWRLATHPRYHELIERYVISWDTRKLSQAALETLAIIAYTQPVTRSQVSSIRGVSSDSSISSLVEKGLVREAGVANAPGNPTMYATTRAFLEKFGLSSVKDLTDISEFAPDEETKKLISERLSSTTEEVLITESSAIRMAQEVTDELGLDIEGASDAASLAQGILAQADAEEDARSEEVSEMFRNAIASTLGVVDKIDFDELEFDISDE